MARKTDRWDLQALEAGDDLSEDSYAFVDADRDLIDALLKYAVEDHQHTGSDAEIVTLDAPELTLDTSAGGILSGQRVRYKISLVDSNGQETAASAESYIDTPDAVDEPAAVTLTNATTGGTHIPGVYFYVLSAYQDFSTSESMALNPAGITVPPTTNTNSITLGLPSLPDGATGFNVYRRAPGSIKYFYLDSIDMEVATPPTTYEDDNLVAEDCDRSLPTENTTYSTNTITVGYPGATPVVPDGYTWKIYRTYTADDYDNSLLWWVVEETTENSGIITTTYDDVGEGTTVGGPPSASSAHGSPPKINHTNAAEITGVLPTGLNVIPLSITFAQAGTVVAQTGEFIWVCDYDYAQILGCRASLGRSSYPDSTDVIVDVNKYDAQLATPAWATIYTTQANRPKVLVGDFIGTRTVPDITELLEGDALSVDIDQSGGGGATDADLIVTVFMLVQSESRTVTTDLA